MRSMGTLLSAHRFSRSPSGPSSSDEVATTTLPQISYATPLSLQNSTMARRPAVQKRAFSEPGL